jgi:predicted nucleotidyltransferase
MFPQQQYLKAFTEYIRSDSNILGCFLGGSFANKTNDRYSDLDIRIIVKDKTLKQYLKNRYHLLEKFGDPLFTQLSYAFGDRLAIVYFKDHYKVDCLYFLKKELSPSYWYKDILILKDQGDFLSRVKRDSKQVKKSVSRKQFDIDIMRTYATFIDCIQRYKRGEYWQCFDNLNQIRKTIFLMHDVYYGQTPLFERRIEGRMSKGELNDLEVSSISGKLPEYIERYLTMFLKYARRFKKYRKDLVQYIHRISKS